METPEELRTEQIQNSLIKLGLGNLSKALPSSATDKIRTTPGISHVLSFYDRLAARRAASGLTTPIKFEDFTKEVEKEVLPTLYMSQGLRADINQTLNIKPMFNVMQSFAVGNGRDSNYNFTTIWGTDRHFLRGGLDNELNVNAHGATRISDSIISRFQAHASDKGAQVVLETDVAGPDFFLNLRTMNPSFLDSKFSGILGLNFSQSITKRLTLGLGGTWQRQQAEYPASAGFELGARYATDTYIGSGILTAQGMATLGFTQKLTDKVQAAVSTQLDLTGMSNMAALMAGEPPTPSGTTVAGVKVDFPDQSTIRAQIDSTGKLGFAVDRFVAPTVKMTISSELDQVKNTCKIGLGLQIESQSESVAETMMKLQTADRDEARKFMADPPQ
ncbi:eukaryotic porin-domain-containing protein [Lipomyces starkeyi]